ncbi:MAG TPA: hypothetical protein ENJ55_04050 [Rhizobiales bacterium]|nr:hypothetical protein [Hyphomicrobiales bacterium]
MDSYLRWNDDNGARDLNPILAPPFLNLSSHMGNSYLSGPISRFFFPPANHQTSNPIAKNTIPGMVINKKMFRLKIPPLKNDGKNPTVHMPDMNMVNNPSIETKERKKLIYPASSSQSAHHDKTGYTYQTE